MPKRKVKGMTALATKALVKEETVYSEAPPKSKYEGMTVQDAFYILKRNGIYIRETSAVMRADSMTIVNMSMVLDTDQVSGRPVSQGSGYQQLIEYIHSGFADPLDG